ncbi:RNA-binding RNA annealing protein [Lecanora helva]
MSGKLDQALDDIVKTRRKAVGRRGRGRRVPTGTRVTTAPTGGIQKSTKGARAAAKAAVPTGPAAGSGDTKIIVSNLPSDVNEQQIKEYFTKSVGPVRRAMLTYGPNGVSRGIATIIFSKPGSANDAFVQLNGMLVDKRPIKIEIVVDSSKAAAAAAATETKGLSDRIAQPKNAKNKPKSAVEKPVTNGTTEGRGRGRGRRGRNAGRGKPKTADELDAEMTDYFDKPANGAADATTNGAALPANGAEEVGMDDIS